ncbi:hypothetical protein M0811_06911 [Anaeramoeba ignava]|uniref:ER membrane protein complex subunit 3 n=1 Tax=Anaeramoeba ignava TaxID=1746090 RepID=A0A9Q0RET6_ANAIG|nr:hypothetical protein M0811_06911 [Anaeramoeba ignava]
MKLDPQIKNWVLFPLVYVIFLVGILKNYILKLFETDPKKETKVKEIKKYAQKEQKKLNENYQKRTNNFTEQKNNAQTNKQETIREMQAIQRSTRLRLNGNLISKESYEMRKYYLTEPQKGILSNRSAQKAVNPLFDPTSLMPGLKSNLSNILPQFILMTWVNFFFEGFIVVKFPFPLSDNLKKMFQYGINLKYLNASYVSSLSWYFLVFFGLRGVVDMISVWLDKKTVYSYFAPIAKIRKMPTSTPMMPPPVSLSGVRDPTNFLIAEKENLQLYSHKFSVADSELEILGLKTAILDEKEKKKDK